MHTHLCPFQPNSKLSEAGLRSDSDTFIYYKTKELLADPNIKLYMSPNRAVLTRDRIPTKYIERVVWVDKSLSLIHI